MFRWTKPIVFAAALGVAGVVSAEQDASGKTGLGRAATPAEVAAWDIDVRSDFKGLPKGSGTVDQGELIWESTCATCHGTFAESNLFFPPLIGGTTEEDIETGRVASLTSPTQSVRTTIMKAISVSTLWDYIRRAMPWDNPKSLNDDEVYAVLAYLLNLADIVDYDFTLSDETIQQVQERMPNRNGAVFWEGLWRVDGEPDTHNTACMSDCLDEVVVSSTLPDHARNAHGDLAAQMRIVGPVRGVNALEPPLAGSIEDNIDAVRQHARATLDAAAPTADGAAGSSVSSEETEAVTALLNDNGCLACHARDTKVLGPSYLEIYSRYGDGDDTGALVQKILNGGSGVWGPVPMPPHPNLSEADAERMVAWILDGAPQ